MIVSRSSWRGCHFSSRRIDAFSLTRAEGSPHAGAVGGIVIGALDRDIVSLAQRRLDRDLDKVGRPRRGLPGSKIGVRAGDVAEECWASPLRRRYDPVSNL